MGLNSLRPTAISATAIESASTLYTAPAGGAVVRRFRLTNTDSSERTVHVFITDTSGTSCATTNKWMQVTIPANGWYDDDGMLALLNADTIKAYADSGSKVNATLAIMEL